MAAAGDKLIFPGHELTARMPITGRKRPGSYIGPAKGWRTPASVILIGETKIELPDYCLIFREIGPVFLRSDRFAI